MAERFDDAEVDEDREADQAEDEPEAAEQVQRPVPIAADERDRQQIEEPAKVALDPVPRAAMLARPVVDRQLRYPEAAVLRQHRYEPVELAVEAHAVNHLRPVRL